MHHSHYMMNLVHSTSLHYLLIVYFIKCDNNVAISFGAEHTCPQYVIIVVRILGVNIISSKLRSVLFLERCPHYRGVHYSGVIVRQGSTV